MKKPHTISFLCLLVMLIVASSCVKDVDFEQADDLIILQENSISLVFFDLVTPDFNRVTTPRAVEDTTRLEFINSGFFVDNLRSIEFFFRLENTFSQNIDVDLTFLNDLDEELYTINFPADGSTNGEAVITTFLEMVPMDMLGSITQATQLQYRLTAEDDGNPVSGTLNFRSSANLVLAFGGPKTN